MAKQKDVNTSDKPTFKGIQSFRDKDNFELVYQEGSDVGFLTDERLERLIELGLVEKQ